MSTKVINSTDPLDEAIRIFNGGGIIAYPTETFYGLAVDPYNSDALENLFTLKGRDEKEAISLIVKDIEMVREVTTEITDGAKELINRFWPGPLTLIFKAKPSLPRRLTAGGGTIALRVSSNEVADRLVTELGTPITSTSANPSGKAPATGAEDVLNYFEDKIDLLIDGGILRESEPSTILDVTGALPKIIREGAIKASDIF